MEFSRRNLGQIIVGSAILEDTIGWMIIAVTFSLTAAGTIDVRSVAQALIGIARFLFVSFTVGRRFVAFVIRWANDNFERDFLVITAILVIMIAMALTTHFIDGPCPEYRSARRRKSVLSARPPKQKSLFPTLSGSCWRSTTVPMANLLLTLPAWSPEGEACRSPSFH
jgi:hypothetical protein